jgi:hypothetical protein
MKSFYLSLLSSESCIFSKLGILKWIRDDNNHSCNDFNSDLRANVSVDNFDGIFDV